MTIDEHISRNSVKLDKYRSNIDAARMRAADSRPYSPFAALPRQRSGGKIMFQDDAAERKKAAAELLHSATASLSLIYFSVSQLSRLPQRMG